MVEFQVVQDGRAGPVMHKLAALVEEGRVVLVGFNHKQWAALTLGQTPQAGGHAKVQGYTANQKAGRQSRLFQDPTEHGGGGGFAVGARHSQHVPRLARGMQHMVTQPLRAAGVGQTCF